MSEKCSLKWMVSYMLVNSGSTSVFLSLKIGDMFLNIAEVVKAKHRDSHFKEYIYYSLKSNLNRCTLDFNSDWWFSFCPFSCLGVLFAQAAVGSASSGASVSSLSNKPVSSRIAPQQQQQQNTPTSASSNPLS